MKKSFIVLWIVIVIIIIYGALSYFGVLNSFSQTTSLSQSQIQKPGTAVYSVGISRSLPETAKPGETISVYLDVKIGSAKYYIIDEQVPDGWVVSEASNEGSFQQSGHVKWAVISNAKDGIISYVVHVPVNAKGIYRFSGSYALEKGSTIDISGSSGLNVE